MGEKQSPARLNLLSVQLTSSECPQKNKQQIFELLEPFDQQSIDWICLPENSLYNKVKNSSEGLSLDSPEICDLQAHANENNRCIHLGALPLKEKQGVSNASVILTPGQKPQVLYRKIHLFDIEMGMVKVKESDHFVAGGAPSFFDYDGWRFGFSICYDLRFSELFLYYAQNNVDVIFCPSAFTQATGRAHWQTLVRSRAIENQCYMVAPAQAGVAQWEQESRASFGHSMVVDPWGKVLSCMTEAKPQAQLITLEKAKVEKTRSILPISSHRRLTTKIDWAGV